MVLHISGLLMGPESTRKSCEIVNLFTIFKIHSLHIQLSSYCARWTLTAVLGTVIANYELQIAPRPYLE
jgi:hypothetical protein